MIALLLLPALLSGCDWRPIDAQTGLTIALIAGGAALAFMPLSLRRWGSLALLMLAVSTSGCLLKGMPANATLAVKLRGDVAALEKIGADVALNCGPELAAFGKTVTTILAVAATYEDLLADVSNAAALYQDGKMDVAAVRCVINTVRADVKALTPDKKAMLERIVAELEAGQSLPYSVAVR